MSVYTGVKAILIDIDNTLLDFNRGSEASMKKCMIHFGIEHRDGMYETFKRINDGLWHRIEKGELTKDELHRIRWGLVFEELGIDFDGVEFETEFLETLKTSSVPVDGAFELLEHLRKRYIVCAASNAPSIQQRSRLENCGMIEYFDKLFISEEIGHPKPSASFFDACLAALPGISREEAVMIGDSLTADIYGGVEYGLRTVWFNFEKRDIPSDIGNTAVVHSLWEISEIL